MNVLRRIDDAWARFESRLILLVLIAMVLVAGFQSAIRNLTFHDVKWASDMLMEVEWADSFLRKGTLWLAFLGASLATYYEKHIGIDVLQRIAPPRARWGMKALTSFLAAFVTLGLVLAFSDAVYLNLTERPIDYEVLGPDGPMHVCDAAPTMLAELDFERPSSFCAMRSALAIVGVPTETPGAAFQIIVPLMFFVMALRLIGKGAEALLVLKGGDAAIAAADAADSRTTTSTVAPSPGTGEGPDMTAAPPGKDPSHTNKDEG